MAIDPANGVVVHLDEPDPAKHAAVLGNITNLMEELGDGSPVELVVHGGGLEAALADGPEAERLRRLLGQGLRVAACANTMRREGVTAEQLVEGVSVVPAGVAQLVRRQRQGWAYVRP